MEDKQQKVRTSVMRPFGPTILKAEMPDFVVNDMIDLTDKILETPDYPSYGSKLIGQISSEPEITKSQLESIGMIEIFDSLVKNYVTQLIPQVISKSTGTLGGQSDPTVEVSLKGCWAISQYENEYNPVHSHGSCQISCIMYLKVPEFTPRNIEGKNNDIDGCIEFIHGGSADHNHFIRPTVRIKPTVGDFYVFPNTLLHTVYPFLGDGERRSISCNYLHKVIDSETGVQVLGDSVNANNGRS